MIITIRPGVQQLVKVLVWRRMNRLLPTLVVQAVSLPSLSALSPLSAVFSLLSSLRLLLPPVEIIEVSVAKGEVVRGGEEGRGRHTLGIHIPISNITYTSIYTMKRREHPSTLAEDPTRPVKRPATALSPPGPASDGRAAPPEADDTPPGSYRVPIRCPEVPSCSPVPITVYSEQQ